MASLEDVILGRSFDGDQEGGADFAEGTITDVGPGGISYTIESYDGGLHSWGPSPYPQWNFAPGTGGGTISGPQPGYRCLVVFPLGTVVEPWVIGWWPKS